MTIDSAILRLWPEYDKPGLLVIFDGEFSTGATFPQQVAFPLPAGAHDIQATVKDTSGDLLSQPWQMQGEKLSYTLPAAGFQIEFYVDLPTTGEQRSMTYTFQAPYAIKQLLVEVQQPARATGFTVTPAAQNSLRRPDGLTYYQFARNDMPAGDSLGVTLGYTKADRGTSVTPPPLPTAAAGSAAAGSGSAPAGAGNDPDLRSLLPWLLIGVGLAALAAAAVYYFVILPRRQSEPAAYGSGLKRGTGRSPVRLREGRRPLQGAAGAAFCPNCGRRYGPEDEFCARCGATRRR